MPLSWRTHRILAYLLPLLALGLGWPVRDKRAFSYIANQTVCVVDNEIYRDGDPIPTDDPCESCKCRPPGFSCVLRECEVKPGCKAIRREGECCPEYQCGCEHNGKFFNDGDRIPNAESPCYSCYCQGSSITCALADCKFRFDCEPEYVSGECCPRYDHCPPDPSTSTLSTTRLTSIFTTLPSTTLAILSTNRTTVEPEEPTTTTAVPSSSPSSAASTVNEGSTSPLAIGGGSSSTVAPVASEVASPSSSSSLAEQTVTQLPSASSSVAPAAISEATAINEIPAETTVAPAAAVVRDEIVVGEQGEAAVTTSLPVKKEEPPFEANEVEPVLAIVTAKPIVVTGSEELVEEPYQTTKTWIPDTSLAAEHKEQPIDDLALITTEIPAIAADSLDSLVTENEIAAAGQLVSDNKQPSAIQESVPATTVSPPEAIVNEVGTTIAAIAESQTVSALTGNNSTDSLNINVIAS